MNQLDCHVCQQQIKIACGLSWHLDRIHDRAVGDAPSDPSNFEEGNVKENALEIAMESLRAELTNRLLGA